MNERQRDRGRMNIYGITYRDEDDGHTATSEPWHAEDIAHAREQFEGTKLSGERHTILVVTAYGPCDDESCPCQA